MASTNPARGMRDFLPSDVRKREYVINIIKEVYESYGFEPLETPAVENLETLMGKYGEEGNQLIFKILKRGQSFWDQLEDFVDDVKNRYDDENPVYPPKIESIFCDLALRYDLTVPLARVVANRKNDLPKFFKRYQIQPVWRADRPARGRYREFYQCDVDAIGSASMLVEAELISAVSEILRRLQFKDFIIRINHRKLLSGLLHSSGIASEEQADAVVAIDKLDKIGSEGVVRELVARGVAHEVALRILMLLEGQKFLDKAMKDEEFLEKLFQKVAEEELAVIRGDLAIREGASHLRQIMELLSNDVAGNVQIDPSLARGLSYYTGTIMEINVLDLAGSLGGGGRYDGLIGMFGKEQIPACGFSLGLERILVVMDERGMFPPEIADSAPADVLVTLWNEESIPESLKLANELRSAGLRVTLYPEPDKLGKQLKYADAIKVPFACILGESEIADNKVTIKNMRTGEQQTCERSEAQKIIKL